MTDIDIRPSESSDDIVADLSEPDPELAPKPKPKPGPKSATPAERADATSGRTPRTRTSQRVGVGIAGLVFALLVAAVVVLTVRTVHDHNTIARQNRLTAARASVLTAAKRDAIDFTTYDYTNLDAGFKRTEAELTGRFKSQYTTTTKALKQTIVKYHAKATSTLHAIAVQSVTPTDAVVIAFVDQTITNTTSTTPQVDRNRMQITLHRKGSGPWLITDLQLP